MGLFSRKKKAPERKKSDYEKRLDQVADVLGNTRIKNKRTLQRVLAPYIFAVDDDWNLKDAKKERKNLARTLYYLRREQIGQALGYKEGARALDGIHWIRRRRGRKLASDALYHLLAVHAIDEDPYKQEVDPEGQQMALQDEDDWLRQDM